MRDDQLTLLRKKIVYALWETHYAQSSQLHHLHAYFKSQGAALPLLDHFAIIDLPSKHSGIFVLEKIFSRLGFVKRGNDYLPEKQNDFAWMIEKNYQQLLAKEILPQVVIADFRLHEMPEPIKQIIEKYTAFVTPFDFNTFDLLLSDIETNQDKLVSQVMQYFSGRDWPLPTLQEFKLVQSFNELLAWVFIFGRQPNHFTLAIHLSDFKNLAHFLSCVTDNMHLPLNTEGNLIKGGETHGIAQASTKGTLTNIQLTDGMIEMPHAFVEFVWRYPNETHTSPTYFMDYYPDFIAQHANRVIESLYVKE